MSATADMGRAVEQSADPPVGSEIGATIRVAGPAGIGDARRLVEIDGKPYLLLDRLLYPVRAGKPLRRAPVPSGVASKFLGIESCAHDNNHDTADQRSRGDSSPDFGQPTEPAASPPEATKHRTGTQYSSERR